MGYESRIIIVERKTLKNRMHLSNPVLFCGSEIARFDLAKMGCETVGGCSFRDIFTIPVDFDLYVNQEDKDDFPSPGFFREDVYGEVCKWATIDNVIDWLEHSVVATDYRRAALFLDFLRILKKHEKNYTQLCIVHYGY